MEHLYQAIYNCLVLMKSRDQCMDRTVFMQIPYAESGLRHQSDNSPPSTRWHTGYSTGPKMCGREGAGSAAVVGLGWDQGWWGWTLSHSLPYEIQVRYNVTETVQESVESRKIMSSPAFSIGSTPWWGSFLNSRANGQPSDWEPLTVKFPWSVIQGHKGHTVGTDISANGSGLLLIP